MLTSEAFSARCKRKCFQVLKIFWGTQNTTCRLPTQTNFALCRIEKNHIKIVRAMILRLRLVQTLLKAFIIYMMKLKSC